MLVPKCPECKVTDLIVDTTQCKNSSPCQHGARCPKCGTTRTVYGPVGNRHTVFCLTMEEADEYRRRHVGEKEPGILPPGPPPRTPQRAIRLALHVLLEELEHLDGERKALPGDILPPPTFGEIADKVVKLYTATSEHHTSRAIGSLCEMLEKFLESFSGDGIDEFTMTADRLSDCWLLLDTFATKGPMAHPVTIASRNMLIKHQAPGWKPDQVKDKLATLKKLAEAPKCVKCGRPVRLDAPCLCGG